MVKKKKIDLNIDLPYWKACVIRTAQNCGYGCRNEPAEQTAMPEEKDDLDDTES